MVMPDAEFIPELESFLAERKAAMLRQLAKMDTRVAVIGGPHHGEMLTWTGQVEIRVPIRNEVDLTGPEPRARVGVYRLVGVYAYHGQE